MARDADDNPYARKRVKRTEETVEQRSSCDDKFVVSYRNQLYDIFEFLRYHPGGKKALSHFKNKGLDKAFEENPHSKAAFHLLQEFTLNNEEKYQEYEDLIDWDEPILQQVGSLGDKYWEWVNLPVNRRIRMFRSDLFEIASITPWYLVPLVWIPVNIYFVYSGWTRVASDYYTGTVLFEIITSYVFGIFIWTMLEYVLHRKVFHFKPPATSKKLIALHFVLHGVHHKAPFDNRRLVFPPVPGILIALLLLHIYKATFPETVCDFIAAGTTTGYICYDLIHYYLHHGAPKAGTYMYFLKRNHNYHHFVHHDLGYGICSKLWDYVFGTNICLRQLTKPIEW